MKKSSRPVVLIFFAIFIPSLLVLLLVTAGVYEIETKTRAQIAMISQNADAELLTASITADLRDAFSDLMVFASEFEVWVFDHQGRKDWRDVLVEEYLSVMRTKTAYGSISFLDETGREIFNICSSPGGPYATAYERLRNIGQEQHFIKTRSLDRKGLFISTLVNDEGAGPGKTLFFHLGKPLYDKAGTMKGVLFVRYLASTITDKLRNFAFHSTGIDVVIDSAGMVVMREDIPGDGRFHGEYQDTEMLRERFPTEWKRITGQDRGQFETSQGLFSFRTIYFDDEARRFAAKIQGLPGEGTASRPSQGYFWKVISYLPRTSIKESAQSVLRELALLDMALLVVIALISWFLAVARSRREKAEEALRESEAQYSTLVEQAHDGVLLIKEGVIAFSNSAMREITLYQADELKGMRFLELVVPEDREKAGEALGSCSKLREKPPFLEIGLTGKDGAKRHIEFSSCPISLGGEYPLMAVLRDITARKLAEDELAKAREEFISTLTHDMKSPLTSIMGFLQLIADRRFGEISQRKLDFVQTIRNMCEVLLSMINNIVNASRLQAGEMSYHMEDFSLKGLLGELEETFHSLAVIGNVTLDFRCSGELWLHGDRARIREVFYNLISNALRYTPSAGTIIVNAAGDKGRVNITLSDTGCGIPQAEQGKLFQKFSQVKGERQGTGLGLFIVKNILAGHGSTIKLESTPGKGTAYFFSLPEGMASVEEAPAVKSIIIAGDDQSGIEAVKEMLALEGYSIEVTRTCKDLIEMLGKKSYSLLILYQKLQDREIADLAGLCGKEPLLSALPRILITTLRLPSTEGAFDEVIPLPVDTQLLKIIVKKVLARNAPSGAPL
ncbi:MAG: ATP-binding protein [Candidatus Eremiobacteraeota bacterium]|nr:ATP-binding protein [Candidatus Eremiobacteraeota bacterium]